MLLSRERVRELAGGIHRRISSVRKIRRIEEMFKKTLRKVLKDKLRGMLKEVFKEILKELLKEVLKENHRNRKTR
jgi:hypothetical protein